MIFIGEQLTFVILGMITFFFQLTTEAFVNFLNVAFLELLASGS